MGPIKFRAFIKRARIMVGVRAINFEKEFILTSQGTRYEFLDIILMQYTGLNDKNGVEIYDRDIVSDCGSTYTISIRYHHGLIALFGTDTMNHGFNRTAEVIGNIFQNPELLKS